MSVGFSQTKQDIDARGGSLCTQLRDTLAGTRQFYAFLTGLGPQGLQAAGYTPTEATLWLTNFQVLDLFAQVFQGLADIPADVLVESYAQPFVGVS